MVGLFMKATLENVREIHFPENTEWTLDVQQSGSSEVRERVTINAQDEFEVPNSKNATANFLVKFEGAKAPSSINMVTPTRSDLKLKDLKNAKLGEYPEDKSGTQHLIAVFECRGAEPCRWYPVGPFRVTSTGGQQWEEADLSDA